MIKFFQITIICILATLIVGCSQVLQTVDLKINAEDNSVQEEFNVVEKTLTIKEARRQNNAPYAREVLQNRRGQEAQSIPEKLALISNYPPNRGPIDYKIGVGDVITLSRLIDNNKSYSSEEKKWPASSNTQVYKLGIGDTLALTIIKDQKTPQNVPSNVPSNNSNSNQSLIIRSQQNDNTIESTGRIGSDGSVLLLEVGRLEASGKSLNELRSEVRNILIRNGVSPRFQLEIVQFTSKRAYLTVSSLQGIGSQVVNLTDQTITLLDILTRAKISYHPGIVTEVKLQRQKETYTLYLRDIFNKVNLQVPILDRDHIFVEEASAQIIPTSSRVDYAGNVVFEGVGKIKAAGYSLVELQSKIKNLMQKVPGSQNTFQLQIAEFHSQTALLYNSQKSGALIPIKDTPIKLAHVLTKNNLSVSSKHITRITLHRDGASYAFTLDDLFNLNTQNLYVYPEDRITSDILPYKENKVFILGGVEPQIFKISPANRETLADVLFAKGGPLSDSSAKRSEVYLLRGNNPVIAYHLDAQSPTRLIVADEMELRPNDILYVAEQPIISFNRTLTTIIPLRLLLRDIKDNDIP